MLTNLKALVVVLPIATAIFIVARPICLRYMAEDDFARRRNLWIALTMTAFVSPSFWWFALVSVPLIAWVAHKDVNPMALYVLIMHVIPPNVGAQIPVVGINELFELNNYRILSLVVLMPVAWRLLESRDKRASATFALADILILAYAILYLVLLMPYESITHTMRRGFLFITDALVLYFVASRACTDRRILVEVMASLCLVCAILAPVALFESFKGWLLYAGIGDMWGDPLKFAYLFRSDTLRAQASTGHSLALGYLMALGVGFWLFLRSRVQSRGVRTVIGFMLLAGLLAAYARGPWLVAVVIVLVHAALGPNAGIRLVKILLASALVGGLIVVSPIGERVLDNLPFIGAVDEVNVSYRQKFLEASWQLIKQNPFFGSPFVLLYLESLRQGQGIIDLINSYTTIAMYYGLVGLLLLLGPFFVSIWNAYRLVRNSAVADPDLSALGASLITCMAGTLVMMAIGSFGTSLEKMFFMLAGLAAGYARLKGQPMEPTLAPQREVAVSKSTWEAKRA